MPRLNIDRQKELEPERMVYAIQEIEKLGYKTAICPNGKSLKFLFEQHVITFFPYSGWHTGKTIKDGRGLKNLLTQIKPKNKTQ